MAAAKLCALLDGVHTLQAALGDRFNDDMSDKHYGLVRDELQKLSLTFEDAAFVTAKLKLMIFWPEERISQLIGLMSDSITGPSSSASYVSRKGIQDYSLFPLHLTEAVWNELFTSKPVPCKLQCLMLHLAKLGLRSPSENTWAMICVLTHLDIEELAPNAKHAALLEVKTLGKRCLEVYGCSVVAAWLEKLPEQRNDLKPYCFDCFDELVPCKQDVNNLKLAMKAIPLRSSNKAMKEDQRTSQLSLVQPSCSVSSQDLMSLLGGLFRQVQASASTANSGNERPRITIFQPSCAAVASTPAEAVGVRRSHEFPMEEPTAQGAQKASTPAAICDGPGVSKDPFEIIEMLQKEAEVLKRPASNSSAKVDKKKKMNKPSSNAKKTISKSKEKAKDPKKSSDVPSATERMKLKPNGCSKCRRRPGCCDSCWKSRKSW